MYMADIDTLGGETFEAVKIVKTRSHDALIRDMECAMHDIKLERDSLLVEIYQNASIMDHDMIEERILSMKTILKKLENDIINVKNVLDQDLIKLCKLIKERRAIMGTISHLRSTHHG